MSVSLEASSSLSSLLRRRAPRACAVSPLDVVDHHLLEVGGHRRAAQRHGLLAVDEDRRGRLLAGAGQRNADVGVLALARIRKLDRLADRDFADT